MNELFAVLLSWAATLSGYPMPDKPPDVVFVSHEFFVKHACHEKECRVFGWYAGGKEIYLLEGIDYQKTFASSVAVHEMVHYLQNLAKPMVYQHGLTARDGQHVLCGQTIERERQAYAVQREFLLSYGIYWPVGISMTHVGCETEAGKAVSTP